MTLPSVTIACTTWLPPGEDGEARLRAVCSAVASWHRHLEYDGAIHLHVADDGTDDAMMPELREMVGDAWGYPSEISYSQQARRGVGASLNAGLAAAAARGDLILHAVDDWELAAPFDLTPWATLLLEDASIGMVRFFPHPDLTGRVQYLGPLGHALLLDRHHFAFATRPFLAHRRFFDAYGPFKEGVNAYDCERLYNDGFCHGIPLADGRLMHEARPGVWSPGPGGPDIVLALPSLWEPIASVELAHIVPRPPT